MAENKKSFITYCEWQETFIELSDEEAGKLIKHIFAYVNDENPVSDDKVVRMCFIPIKQTLKRDLKKYEVYIKKQKVNGAKGGRPKITQITQRLKKEPKKADSVNVNVNDINNNYNNFVDEVKDNRHSQKIESLYMRLKIRQGTLTPLLKEFKLHIIEEDRIHKDTNEFFKNFKNWLNVQDRIKQLDKYR